jgi:hypothetical protein
VLGNHRKAAHHRTVGTAAEVCAVADALLLRRGDAVLMAAADVAYESDEQRESPPTLSPLGQGAKSASRGSGAGIVEVLQKLVGGEPNGLVTALGSPVATRNP